MGPLWYLYIPYHTWEGRVPRVTLEIKYFINIEYFLKLNIFLNRQLFNLQNLT